MAALVCCMLMPGLGVRIAHAQSPAPVPAATLTIGREPEDSLIAQVSIAVLTEAFRRAGIGMAFARLPLSRSAEAANGGEVDGDLNRIALVAEKYSNLMLVPVPINRVDVAIYGASASLQNKSRDEIRKLSVVIQRGIFVLGKYSQGMRVTDTSTVDSAMEMLLNGRGDVLMLTYADAELWLARNRVARAGASAPYADVVRWPYAWASEPLYLLLNRRHAALVPRLAQALLDMRKEGVIEREYRAVFRRFHIPLLESEPGVATARKSGGG